MKYDSKYTIIVPVYNSNESLVELYDKIKDVFSKLGESFETIFVDDFSLDNSWSILEIIKNNNQNEDITLVKLSQNYGQDKALLCGINLSVGEYIITIDDDLQVYPEEIIKLINEQQIGNYDLVYGSYTSKKHSKIKNIGSNLVHSISSIPLKDGLYPSSFRLFKSDLKNKFSYNQFKSKLFIDELLLWQSAKISAAKVIHRDRKYKTSSYSNKKLFSLGLSFLVYSTDIPLNIITAIGLIGSVTSFLFAIRFIYRWFAHSVPLGYTSIIVAILFSTSLILLVLSVLGKHISELNNSINKKPPYLINKIVT